MDIKRLAAPILAGLLAGSALAACSSDDGTTADQPIAEEQPTLRVVTQNNCDEFNLFWAQDKGLFDKHGIQVEFSSSGGGSAGISALVSGAADVAFTNSVTAVLSTSKGIPVVYIADAYDSAVPPLPPSNGLWVKTDSPIQGPSDLVGKKIAVNELGGINELVTSQWLDKKGIDPKAVEFVALPFPQMPNAAINGQIDAFEASLASSSGAPKGSIRSVGDPYHELGEPLLYSGYLMTDESYQENKETAEKFFDALQEAHEATTQDANLQESYEIASTYCKSPVEAIPNTRGKKYRVDVSMAALAVAADILLDNDQIDKKPNLDDMVADFARVD